MCSRCHYVCRTVWSQQRFYHLLTKEKPYRSRTGPRTLARPHQVSELLDRMAQPLFVLLNSFVPVTEKSHAAALSSVQFCSVQFSAVQFSWVRPGTCSGPDRTATLPRSDGAPPHCVPGTTRVSTSCQISAVLCNFPHQSNKRHQNQQNRRERSTL